MAGFFKDFINSLHINDDDDDNDEEYERYVEETTQAENRRAEREEMMDSRAGVRTRKNKAEQDEDDESRQNMTSFSEYRKDRSSKSEKSSRIVPLRSGNGANSNIGIRVMKPTCFEDSQDICDVLLNGKATIINLEGFDVDLAQRVMDFISGAVYAANGKLHQISNYIFLISPDAIDVSGDYLDMIKQNGFEVPTINRDI